jgi:dTDP-4-dehydrorhamnose reductase
MKTKHVVKSKKPAVQNFLVFGANGQIGSEIHRRLSCREDSVSVCKTREATDITDLAGVKKLIKSVRPFAVVNVAGDNNRLSADRSSMWRVNVQAVDNMVRCCALYGVPFIHVSSDEVFGGDNRKQPFREIDVTCPASYYGMTKVMAEHTVLNVSQVMLPEVASSRFQQIIVRTSMPFEQIGHFRNTFTNYIAALSSKRLNDPVKLPTDIVRSPTYVPHLVDHLMWLMEHVDEVPSGIYHIASQDQVSLYEFAGMLRSTMRVAAPIAPCRRSDLHPKDELAKYPHYTALNCERWSDICPLPPLPSWQEGLEACIGRRNPLKRLAAV